VTDHNRSQSAGLDGAAISASLERVRLALERLRASDVVPSETADVRAILERSTDLLAALQTLIPPIEARIPSGGWDPAEALAARAALDIYDRAVAELRRVSGTARKRVEEAQRLFEEVHEFARESRHRAKRIERRMSGSKAE
jgi:hypothetical protein